MNTQILLLVLLQLCGFNASSGLRMMCLEPDFWGLIH